MTQTPTTEPPAQSQRPPKPDRGAMILVFGILGIVMCFIFGIVAWVMGNADLAEMKAGRMDPRGEGLTKAGKICGIIGVVIPLLLLSLYVLLFLLIGVAAVSYEAVGTGAGG